MTYDVARFTALSDGVFAIVITLLVIDLKLPDPPLPGEHIADELLENLYDTLGWLVSFVALARFWMIHHHVVNRIHRVRTGTIVANFGFLGAISLVPFGASLLGSYEFSEPLAVAAFSTMIGFAAFLLGVFSWFASRDGDASPEPDDDLVWHIRHHLLVVPALAVVAAGAAYLNPLTTMLVWLVEAVFAVVVLVTGGERRRREGATGDPS
jgi:uncharacterized membrane protein